MKMHRSFGHPSVSVLYILFKSIQTDEVVGVNKTAIDVLQKPYKMCTCHADKAKGFNLTSKAEAFRFNKKLLQI